MKDDAIAGIAAWLRVETGARAVSPAADPDRDVVVFRLDLADGLALRELEVSFEALDDFSPEGILIDLGREGVPERLRRDPTMRLMYRSDRAVPHHEALVVSCDDREYRVVPRLAALSHAAVT